MASRSAAELHDVHVGVLRLQQSLEEYVVRVDLPSVPLHSGCRTAEHCKRQPVSGKCMYLLRRAAPCRTLLSLSADVTAYFAIHVRPCNAPAGAHPGVQQPVFARELQDHVQELPAGEGAAAARRVHRANELGVPVFAAQRDGFAWRCVNVHVLGIAAA